MAQSTAVVRNTLTATLSGTTDFTSSGFGTPAAALVIVCNGNSTNNPQDDSLLSIGFWDGTNQRCIGFGPNTDNVGTTSTRRFSNDTRGLGCSLFEYTISATTDGIRLTLDVDATAEQRYATVILLSGISAKALTFTPNATQNLTTESASLGFAPGLILFLCIGHSPAVKNTTNAIMTFGFARSSDGMQRMLGWASTTGVGTSTVSLQHSETRCVGQVFGGSLSWSGEVTTFGSDTFTMTTRDGGSGSDICFALALGGADFSFDAGTLTTPTSTGTDAVSTSIQPDALLIAVSSATSTTIETGANADGVSLGMSDGTNDYSHNATEGDALTTMNNRSVASASGIIDVDVESSGYTDLIDATVDSFNASDFTLNYSVVSGTARKGWYIAFGPVAAGGVVTVNNLFINQAVQQASNF